MFLRILESVGIFLAILVLVTQVIIPLLLGRHLFPLFRNPDRKLEKELAQETSYLAEEDLRRELTKLRRKTRKKEPAHVDRP
jgi:hypothetical protein